MSAPSNDNWANAISLSGSSGSGSYSNAGANPEVGEPANNGKTVWFKWTAPKFVPQMYFSIRYGALTATAQTNPFRNKIQVFVGSSVSALAEVTYSFGNYNRSYAGWDWGGMAVFNATSGVTYYIRVDGVSASTVTNATIRRGGSGYSVGDTLTLDLGEGGGTVLTVTSVSGGAITGLTVTTGGTYYQKPPSPNFLITLTGSGSGAAVNLTFGSSTSEGDFYLVYDEYFDAAYGCSGCPPQFDTSLQCVAGSATPSVLSNDTVSFGTIPAGTYIIKYVGGAFNVGTLATDKDGINIAWTVQLGNVGSGSHSEYIIHYFSGGSATTASLSPIPANPNSTGNAGNGGGTYSIWRNQGEVENAYFLSCVQCLFVHSGGAISIEFSDTNYADNSVGNPSPTFCLYKAPDMIPDFSIDSACASWTTLGSAATCTFTLKNNNPVSWNNVTVSLDSAGGVSGSSILTNQSFPKSSSTTLSAITFNCSTSNTTATIRLSCVDWASDVVLNVFLGPVMKYVSHTAFSSGTCGTPAKQWRGANFKIQNIGYWTVDATAIVSFDNGISAMTVSPCAVVPSVTFALGTMTCVNGTQNNNIFCTPGSPTNSNMTIAFNDSIDTFNTVIVPLTIPS